MARAALPALLCLLLAGCGWQLRGASLAALDGQQVYPQFEVPPAELRGPLLRGLRQSGAAIADSPDAADATLTLLEERQARRPISVDTAGRVQEYELVYELSFGLEATDGGALLGPETVTVSEVYRYERDNVLGSQAREAEVLRRLREDAVRLLLPRVQAALAAAE